LTQLSDELCELIGSIDNRSAKAYEFLPADEMLLLTLTSLVVSGSTDGTSLFSGMTLDEFCRLREINFNNTQ
jgi:hypothetical protein